MPIPALLSGKEAGRLLMSQLTLASAALGACRRMVAKKQGALNTCAGREAGQPIHISMTQSALSTEGLDMSWQQGCLLDCCNLPSFITCSRPVRTEGPTASWGVLGGMACVPGGLLHAGACGCCVLAPPGTKKAGLKCAMRPGCCCCCCCCCCCWGPARVPADELQYPGLQPATG